MAEPPTKTGADRLEVKVTADSILAGSAQRLSLERTMMSWLRTVTAPEFLGLALIGSGIVAPLISIWQYSWTARYLWSGSFAPIAGMKLQGMQSPVLAAAFLFICIGLFAFFAVLLRLA